MKAKIVEIGPMVDQFESEMFFVLFGTSAPAELREISVIHEYTPSEEGKYFQEGSTLTIGDTQYTVVEVGDAANANFHELGHVSVYLKEEELLPGAIRVEPNVFPKFTVGDVITIQY